MELQGIEWNLAGNMLLLSLSVNSQIICGFGQSAHALDITTMFGIAALNRDEKMLGGFLPRLTDWTRG